MMRRSKVSRVVQLALRCYSLSWRYRHQDEAEELAHDLMEQGVPAATIALSYLVGAFRERTAPLATRLAALAIVTVISVGLLSAVALGSSTPAGASGPLPIQIAEPTRAASQLETVFRSHRLQITVRLVPTSVSRVGSIVGEWTTGPPGAPGRRS